MTDDRLAREANEDLSEIYEAVFGSDGIDRYTHGELIEMLNEMYDCYKYVVDNVYSKSDSEIMENASGLFLVNSLPTDHTEWSDSQLDSFLNENVLEDYEDYDADGLWRLISDTADVFRNMIKREV
jgi:hypothetical protein